MTSSEYIVDRDKKRLERFNLRRRVKFVFAEGQLDVLLDGREAIESEAESDPWDGPPSDLQAC